MPSRKRKAVTAPHIDAPHPLDFFGKLVWLDKRPLLDTIEPYRRRELTELLYTFGDDGNPLYNRALRGRGKKNYKSSDLVLACLYRFLAWPSTAGNDCYIVANDEGQAGDDLGLIKKLIEANPIVASEVDVRAKLIDRRDGHGRLSILPAQDATGAHGKTYLFLGYDEIWGYRDYDLIEALSPDPTRLDALVYFTSYAPIRYSEGIPLYDLFHQGRAADDPQFHFCWYGGDFTTDPDFAGDDITQEQRANPSMAGWGNDRYLAQQKRRLPSHRYRRLHLNLPGSPDGAAFDAGLVIDAIVRGRKHAEIPDGATPVAAVDMSGGSNDDATLAIVYRADTEIVRAAAAVGLNLKHRTQRDKYVLAHLSSQNGSAPFNPRHAVTKFARTLKEYHITTVTGDNYAGETFKSDFAEYGITYIPAEKPKSFYYEELEPRLNAGEVELLDIAKLQEQLLGLVWRGQRIDHGTGVAIAVWLASSHGAVRIDNEILAQVMAAGRGSAIGQWAGGIPGLDMPYGERQAMQMMLARDPNRRIP